MKKLISTIGIFVSLSVHGQWVNGNSDYDGLILAMEREINNLQFFEPLPNDSSTFEEMDELQKLIDMKYNDVLDGKYSILFYYTNTYKGRHYYKVSILDNKFYDVPTIQDLPKGYGSFTTELCLVEASYQEGKLIYEIEEIFRRLRAEP